MNKTCVSLVALLRIEINNSCLTGIYSLAEESTCHPFVEGFRMIGKYVSAELVAQVVINKLVEQRELDNCFSYLLWGSKALQNLTA